MMSRTGVSWWFLFFSSRRRHTRYWRDWSSDVCSSDLRRAGLRVAEKNHPRGAQCEPGLLRLKALVDVGEDGEPSGPERGDYTLCALRHRVAAYERVDAAPRKIVAHNRLRRHQPPYFMLSTNTGWAVSFAGLTMR